MKKLIEINELVSSVGGKVILNHLNFILNENELVALTGNNGSGKTTLTRIISGAAGFSNVYKKFMVLGFEHKEINPSLIANNGLYISFQQSPMFDHLTIDQLFTELKKIHKHIDMTQIYDEFNLSRVKNNSIGKSLSGGEFKRLELALCISMQPKVIILDEIDSGVDAETKARFVEQVNKLKTSKSAIICISHNKEFLKSLNPDRYLFMSDGKLETQ